MKKWVLYRHRESGQFRNERLFDGESCDQVDEQVEEPLVASGMLTVKTKTFVRILKDGQPVNKHEGELYDVVETNEEYRQRDMLKLLAQLNGVARVMES